MKEMKRLLALVLCAVMLIGMLPVSASAESDDALTAALAEAKTYIDSITVNNSSNDPETVVKNFKTHFTWDNEKRENSKSYLFDWSYYNGVVFEGLEYLYEVSRDETYKDYVVEYMSSLIAEDGTWAMCTNDSTKERAGYVDYHGADCYKTASLLLDAHEMTGDDRYLTMAATLYADLDAAADKYSLPNAGNNYHHTWASASSPNLWLDGLYMILPFRAEYAAYTGDTEELDLIVDRMQWVSDNMYNSAKGLFYHAANSSDSNSGTHWLRSIGWYAAAIVDVMDSMEGENLEAMKAQLVKLVDGMKAVQSSSNGMWLNNLNASESSSNPYETSGTALTCYAVMKAVNNGWLDESYADMAILAFEGICSEKLSDNTLTDICFKGAPGSSNSTFYNNEGKGVGPFIMLYAEVLKYVNTEDVPEETVPETTAPAETEPEIVVKTDEETGVSVEAEGITGLEVEPVEATEVVGETGMTIGQIVAEVLTGDVVAYDITVADFAEGASATVTVPVPAGMDVNKFGVFYVADDGTTEQMEGEPVDESSYQFTTTHFSTYVGGEVAVAAETGTNYGTGYLPGGTRYVLDTNGVDAGASYLIVSASSGNASALRNDGGERAGQEVTVSNGVATISSNESTSVWTFTASGSSWYISNGDQRIRLSNSDILNGSGQELSVYNQGSGEYQITNGSRYLRYNSNYGGSWGRGSSGDEYSVYLFKQETTEGAEVTFTVTPASATIQPGKEIVLTGTVTVAGETVDLSDCTITWESSNTGYATVSDGTVTGVADGTVNITATLSEVDGTALQSKIVLTIPVKVSTREIDSIKVTTPVGTVYKGVGDAAKTGGKITVTYADGGSETIDITVGMLGGDFTTAAIGSYSALSVTYNGDQIPNTSGEVNCFTLHVVEKPDANYPEYPDPGSVDVDKYISDYSQFQNTGVAQIELTTSGLPAQTGVDVILVTDLSNSMAREVGATSDGSYSVTKLDDLKDAVESFADTFLGGGDLNTISLVTFGGYDEDHTTTKVSGYADSTQTLLLGSNSADTVKTSINNIVLTYNTASSTNFYLSFDGGVTTGENYGNTNYDHAFMETYSAVEALKAQYMETNGISYDESGREIYILFMTDGAPSNYNGYYYNYKTGARADVYATWTDTSGSEEQYQMGSNNAQYSQANWYRLISGNNLYWANQVYNMSGVENIINIGFDLDNGGFASWVFTDDSGYPLSAVLENLVSDQSLDVHKADDADTLNKVYAQLASELKLAATNAYFVDQMGDDFNIQMASTVTKFKDTDDETTITLVPRPQIQVSTYKIYTPDDAPSTDMIGKQYGEKTVVETVTFNDAGTQAYSDVLGSGNILIDGVICAKNFWYNTNTTPVMIDTDGDGEGDYSLPGETFYWNIGTINNTEFVLSYSVYLEGSCEGTRDAGSYETNNFADLNYINWLGNKAVQHVESPVLAWESASVYYGFYLVDKDGNPVTNRATGATGAFGDAVKVTSKIFYEEVLLNDITQITNISVASTKVPEGYTVYDNGASYTITIDSDKTISGWTIVNGKEPDTTYVTDYKGTEFSNVLNSDDLETQTGVDYTATTVWFAVVWEPSTLPDVVVIDFGLPVDIGVLENDMFGTAGTLIGVGNDADKPVTNYNQFSESDSDKFGETYTSAVNADDNLKAGDLSIVGTEVRYTPNTMEMPTHDQFSYEVRYANVDGGMEYYYGDVTVIPATTIYYEDNFVELSSYTWNYNTNAWDEVQDGEEKWVWETVIDDTNPDGTQDEDRPDEYNLPYIDANNLYGYDSAYTSMSEYSMGSAMKANVDYDNYGAVNFSFYGTGFDVISLTDNKTGTIFVTVTDSEGNEAYDIHGNKCKYVVDTYYGYARRIRLTTYTYTDGEWGAEVTYPDEMGKNIDKPETPTEGAQYLVYDYEWYTVDGNDPNTLYQVPVIKVEDLPYGYYNVLIQAVYDPGFDHDQYTDASYDFYLDAIRIYDPANDGTGNEVIEDAYKADGEYLPKYYELRNWLIAKDTYDSLPDDQEYVEGIAFIDAATSDGIVTDGENGMGDVVTVSDYTNYGPNNELYLAPGQAVAFKLNASYKAPTGYEVDTVQLELKSVGGTAYAKIWNTTNGTESTATMRTIASATDLYYDITSMDNKTVVVKNVGSVDDENAEILSITNMKVTFKETETSEDSGLESQSIQNPRTLKTMGDLAPVSTFAVNAVADETESDAVETITVDAPFTVSIADVAAAIATMDLNEETEPEETEPEETEPTEPEETEPETTEPEETEPEETEPEETEPEVTEPEETEPEVTEPETTEPEETEPEEDGNGSAIGRLIGWIIGLIGWIFG